MPNSGMAVTTSGTPRAAATINHHIQFSTPSW
jgi:hypothetical protein